MWKTEVSFVLKGSTHLLNAVLTEKPPSYSCHWLLSHLDCFPLCTTQLTLTARAFGVYHFLACTYSPNHITSHSSKHCHQTTHCPPGPKSQSTGLWKPSSQRCQPQGSQQQGTETNCKPHPTPARSPASVV